MPRLKRNKMEIYNDILTAINLEVIVPEITGKNRDLAHAPEATPPDDIAICDDELRRCSTQRFGSTLRVCLVSVRMTPNQIRDSTTPNDSRVLTSKCPAAAGRTNLLLNLVPPALATIVRQASLQGVDDSGTLVVAFGHVFGGICLDGRLRSS